MPIDFLQRDDIGVRRLGPRHHRSSLAGIAGKLDNRYPWEGAGHGSGMVLARVADHDDLAREVAAHNRPKHITDSLLLVIRRNDDGDLVAHFENFNTSTLRILALKTAPCLLASP